MRKCLRCGAEMVENLEVRTNDALGISVGEKGLFKGALSRLVAAACPECGYVETYIADTEKLKKALEGKND